MSKMLSREDEAAKIRRYMTAPVWAPPAPTTQPLPACRNTPPTPTLNLAHYPEHVDFPIMWRAIREAVQRRRPFSWY